jgi:hypothetical protein
VLLCIALSFTKGNGIISLRLTFTKGNGIISIRLTFTKGNGIISLIFRVAGLIGLHVCLLIKSIISNYWVNVGHLFVSIYRGKTRLCELK